MYGTVCILLPVTPTAMISIPIINNAIPKKIDTNTAPAKGDAITKKDIAIAKAPAPMLNPLAQPGLWFLFHKLHGKYRGIANQCPT